MRTGSMTRARYNVLVGLVKIGKADLVIGSRFLEQKSEYPRVPVDWTKNA